MVRSRVRNAGPRLVLATGFLSGLVLLPLLAEGRPGMLAVNFRAYLAAAEVSLGGGALYEAAPPGFEHLPWVYPPVVVVAFYPYVVLDGWQVGFLVHTLTAVAAGLSLGALCIRVAERHGAALSRSDYALVCAFVLASVHSVPSLFYGNVNVHLAFAFAAGFVSLDRGRDVAAGVAFAVPALVKVFPAAVGVWLVRRRSPRGVAAAAATGVGTMAVGVLVLGVSRHEAWLRDALVPRLHPEPFGGGLGPDEPYVTVRRPLSVVFPDLDPTVLSLAALVVLAPVVLTAYRVLDFDDPVARLCGAFVTIAAVLVYFPSYELYYVYLTFPLIPLCYLLAGRARVVFLAGATVGNFGFSFSALGALLSGTPLEPALGVVGPVVTLATPQLYGIALMLAACLLTAGESPAILPAAREEPT